FWRNELRFSNDFSATRFYPPSPAPPFAEDQAAQQADSIPAMTRAPKYLVLGSNAFSGASFAGLLLDRGHEVIGVSRSPEPHQAFLPYRWSNHGSGFRFYQLDLNRDLDAILALIERERPAFVVNFAAQSMVAESWQNPDHWFTTNVVSTVRLHERLRR